MGFQQKSNEPMTLKKKIKSVHSMTENFQSVKDLQLNPKTRSSVKCS